MVGLQTGLRFEDLGAGAPAVEAEDAHFGWIGGV